jgi:hypothetical protein
MNKFKYHILIASGFSLVAAVVAGVTAGPAIAQAVKAALVKNVDERGRVPYQQEVSCQATGIFSCVGSAPRVPAGKRLVVEHISTSIDLQTGSHIIQILFTSINSFASGTTPATFVHPLYETTSFGNDHYDQNESVVQYIEAGDTPGIIVGRDTGTVQMVGLISGYLIDLGI